MSVTAPHQYWSVDSAPQRLTRALSVWTAPLLLVIFTGIATALLFAFNRVPLLVQWFPQGDMIFSPYMGTHSIPLRIFIVSFYIAYAMVAGASFLGRVRFFLGLSFNFILLCGIFDVINVLAFRYFGFVYSLHAVEILSGLFGFFVFSVKLLEHGSMPPRVAAPRSGRFTWGAVAGIVLAGAMAMLLAHAVDRMNLPLVSDLRGVALLGGTGPGVFLLLPVLFLMLYIIGTCRNLVRSRGHYAGPVTVIIPAHNEAHVIERTLLDIAESAKRYEGQVDILVLNNCSTDRTADVASRTLAAFGHVTGRVIEVPVAGKSNALNRGIAETTTDVVIRIDADTHVLPDTIHNAMRHFADPDVGVVGGLPVAPGTGPFDLARNLETLLKHGYYQVAYSAVDSIVGVPGMFAVYRTEAVRQAGGFALCMNGEDTDMSLRIGESGLRIVADPSIRYVSEVPQDYAHLREQRMRWFRSVYHVSARNRDYLDGWHLSARGKIILPFMLLNSARRGMTVPLVIFSAINFLLAFNPESTLTAQAVIALTLGMPALVAIFAALANGRVEALIGLPHYVLFRLLRSYLTLESILSIAFERAPARSRRKAAVLATVTD